MNTEKPENPPAFPMLIHESGERNEGMSLRDYFAAQAIGPLMGSDGFEKHILEREAPNIDLVRDLPRYCAESAYDIADAMLAERAKRG